MKRATLSWAFACALAAGLFLAVSFAGESQDAATITPAQSDEEAHAAHLRASCANNLKQLGIIFKMFANEHKDAYPVLDSRPGRFMFIPKDIYPEYLTDTNIMLCPVDQEADPNQPDPRQNADWYCDDRSYWYLGYAMTNEQEGLAFVEAYRQQVVAGKSLEDNVLNAEEKPIRRLREGIERFWITDINDPAAGRKAAAQIPVLVERPGRHKDGAHVLFLDGHVEFVKYPGKFPMTEKFIKGLMSLDKIESPKKTPAEKHQG